MNGEAPRTDRCTLVTMLGSALREEVRPQYEQADAVIDGALDALDLEEPSLYRYLQTDPDLNLTYLAVTKAMRYAITRGRDRQVAASNAEALLNRMLRTVAWRTLRFSQADPSLPPTLPEEPSGPSKDEVVGWIRAWDIEQ